jgi:LPS-assembly protein
MSWALFHRKARPRPLWLATASGLALIASPVLAQTDDESPPAAQVTGQPDLQTPDVVPTSRPIARRRQSPKIRSVSPPITSNYDSDSEIVIAEGEACQMNREAVEMRADRVTWNRQTGKVFAEGNVVIKNPEGDTAYGDKIDLTDTLRDGVVDNLLVVLDNGSRLAAIRGTPRRQWQYRAGECRLYALPGQDNAGCPQKPELADARGARDVRPGEEQGALQGRADRDFWRAADPASRAQPHDQQ